MRRSKRFLATTLALTFLTANSSFASKGGIEQLNNTFVIGFTYNNSGVPNLCSGVLVAPNVIATARHCVVNKDGIYGINYLFSAPGAELDASIDGTKVPTLLKQIIIPQQTPTSGLDLRLDLAFLVTDKPFATGTPISIATAEEIAQLNDNSVIAGYGYGKVFETGEPYSSFPTKIDLSWKNSSLITDTTSYYELLHENNAACLGDSGGAITLINSFGKEVLLGVISGAGEVVNGCGSKLADGYYRLRMTVLNPHLSLLPKPAASPAPKIRKIICLKGSKKKVVKGVNPKCPKGYKLKK